MVQTEVEFCTILISDPLVSANIFFKTSSNFKVKHLFAIFGIRNANLEQNYKNIK